ncbi:TetR family transcriptional regulator [Bacillus sp. SRB_336]|nr:TetR family transcriptional regulator [Bacillus sp. SRB_336]
MARPIVHDDALRTRLLEVTAQLTADRGVARVGLREIATAAGTSTTAIYSLFGGRQELLTAVVDGGFKSFAESQRRAAPNGLLALGRAYREWALGHRALYALMFSSALGARDECPPPLETANDAIAPLLAAVAGALAGAGSTEQPLPAAVAIWGQVHGLVSLELAGIPLPGGRNWDMAYEAALRAIARAYPGG